MNPPTPRLVIADATPLHYLILIGEVDLLRKLYGTILVPMAVIRELSAPQAPTAVRSWLERIPSWIEVHQVEDTNPLPFPLLGDGEREAISLAQQAANGVLLTDDFQARVAAESLSVRVIPTIRILSTASALELVDLASAISRLQETNFRVSRKVIDRILAQQSVQSKE